MVKISVSRKFIKGLRMKTERQRQRDLAIAIVDLEFDDETIKRTNPELNAGFGRIDRGESTHLEEAAKCLETLRLLKAKG
jgi:hypothetical protein